MKPIIAPLTNPAQRSGLILAVLSAITFSTVGLFTKGVDAGAWEVIFWRGTAAVLFTAAWLVWRNARADGWAGEWAAMGRPGWYAALIGACATSAFIPALKLTTIANVTLIWSAAPLLTALMGWVWMGEKPGARTLIAGAICLIGVSLALGIPTVGSSWQGDALALVMTVLMSGMLLIYRRWPATPAAIPAALSSLFLLPFALILGAPFAVVAAELLILLAFGLVFAIASITMLAAAQRLPASTVSLIGLLEFPLALLWAALVFGEQMTVPTLLGAAMILAALYWSQRAARG